MGKRNIRITDGRQVIDRRTKLLWRKYDRRMDEDVGNTHVIDDRKNDIHGVYW